MELQALLVLCGVGVAGLAMLLLMGLFSASGTSYEEAIAQQRKATTELLALAESKNKPKKKEKKANKKQAKKEKTKESVSATTGSELESEAHAESSVEDDSVPTVKGHVEFSPPVVVDVPNTPPNVKIRKRGKDSKVKPILINKEDPSCVSDPSALSDTTAAVNHFEEMHPKDDFELLHSTLAADKVPEKAEEVVEKKEKTVKPVKAASKPVPKPAASPVAKPATPAVEAPAKEVVTRERHNSGEAPKEQRKTKKTDKKAPVDEVVNPIREEVVPPLNVPQPSELTTEKLLKQALGVAQPPPAAASSPPGGKNKKKKAEPSVLSLMAAGDSAGVNVAELVRVVREAVLSRNEIQILTDALLNKHHDPLPEHSEWTEGPNDPMQKLKKQLADKEKALADEVEASQALHAKLKELRSQLNGERARAAGGEQAAAAARADVHALQARLARLAEENTQLEQHKRLQEQALVEQLAGLQGEALEAARLRVEAARLQQHAADLAQQLAQVQQLARADQHERISAIAELQNEIQRFASHAQNADINAEKAKEELEKFKQEAEKAKESHEKIKEVYDKLKEEYEKSKIDVENVKEEYEKEKRQISNEVSLLREQLSARDTELAELKMLKAVPAQNGLPANDQVKAAELAKVESLVESLRTELSSAQRASRDQREHITRLQEQLVQYQDKNNELRTKNWKVMEALQSAEKSLQMRTASALPAQDLLREALSKAEQAQYSEVANVLRAVCPAAAPTTTADRSWLITFADNLKRELNKTPEKTPEINNIAANNTGELEERLKDLKLQNEQSQSLVEKYKKIIVDTEGVLSHLQHNVLLEEQKWARQLADKQKELDELTQRTVLQMQNKIDSLQEELRHAQSAKHNNHTLADAERTAEERLMSGFTDKHSVDVRNGPLQMGLEEK